MRRYLLLLLELCFSILAFVAVGYFYAEDWLFMDWGSLLLDGLLFWVGCRLRAIDTNRSAWVEAIERTSLGLGLNLQFWALLMYARIGEPTSLELLFSGAGLAGLFVVLLRAWVLRPPPRSVLMLGYSAVGERMAQDLGGRLWGVVADQPEAASRIPYLGRLDAVQELIRQRKPRRILVAGWDLWPGQEALLQQWRKQDISVEDLPSAYENLYLRVCSEGLTPAELLRSPALAASPVMMSLQATYSNLVGLIFLISLSPLLVLLAVLSRLAAGPGPILDRVECAGFQGIPFQRLYFRIRSTRTAKLSGVGTVIAALRLTGLPQLINLVRGEMAMFGPAPARVEFTNYLEQVIPPYSHRLTMRPGVLGWARVHQRARQGVREEVLQLEYDLYYIKQCSPSLDFEILLRTLLRVPHIPGRREP